MRRGRSMLRPRRNRRARPRVACAHVLSFPRSRAARTTPRSIAACRSPVMSTSRTTISATIHAGSTPSPTSITSVARTSTLSAIGSRSVPSGDVRPSRRASLPSKKSVAIASAEHHGRPVRVVVEVPREQQHDERYGSGTRDCQLIRGGHRQAGGYGAGMFDKVLVANRGSSRSASSARCGRWDRRGRRLLGGRSRCAARRVRRRGVPPRADARGRELPPCRADPRRRSAERRAGDPSRLRLPRRERGFRAGGRGRGPRMDRPAAAGSS